MSSRYKGRRGKLLVDMSTGNITTVNEPTFTSNLFPSNAYNPTNSQPKAKSPTLTMRSSLIPSSPPPSISFMECDDIPLDSYFLDVSLTADQSSVTAVQLRTSTSHNSLMQDQITTSIETDSSHIPVTVSASHQQESELNNNYSFMELDEATGLFKAGSSQNDSRDQDGNFILDDQTGKIIFLKETADEPQFDIYAHRNDRQFNKKQRVTGKQYVGKKLEKTQDGEKVMQNFVTKNKKKMKPKSCTHELLVAKTPRTFLCGAISEQQRFFIFDYFWSLETWQEKKAYLKNLVYIRPVLRRRRTSNSNTMKQCGFDCLLPSGNKEFIRVCKCFLLDTLALNNQTFIEWIKSISDDTEHNFNHTPRKKNAQACSSSNVPPASGRSDSAKEWLVLPKVPSHYCRASSKRVYVEDTFRSKTHMFKEYKKWCINNGKKTAHRKLFCSILKNEKISIYKPRKDQCDTCTAFKEGNLDQGVFENHQRMKEEAYCAKEEARSLCSSEVLVLTMDVQSILLAPKLTVSEIYYKQKLQIHNFTIYVNNNREVHLYIWHEGDGGVTANQSTSCIMDFLNSKVNEGYKKVILISDGCCYQNRNKILSSALLSLTKDRHIEIEQRILEKGHTMMEVDSVHSTLENLFKPPIHAPSDYINLMAQARPTNPYIIHHLDYTFFKNYELVCEFESIRPGKKVGDPVVTDIRGLLYRNGEIFYKLRHPEEWQLLPQRARATNVLLCALYNMPRKLEKSKYNSLQSLKKYMHRDYHTFYDNLNHD